MALSIAHPLGALLLLAATTLACSSASGEGTPQPMDSGALDSSTGDADGGGPPTLLEIPCTDTADSTYAAPATISRNKGTVVRCAKDLDIDKDRLLVAAIADGYVGKPFTSGARLYRIQYVTERATSPATPGFSSAVLYIPDTPIAARMPLIVAAHGTGGQNGACAPSQAKEGLLAGGMAYLVRPLVGAGFPVIVPDYAGFAGYGAPGNPPSGYALSLDVGKTLIDGARALRSALPAHLTDQVVLVGHSQGGHTALSTLALAPSYGGDLNIVAAVAYAPLWFTNFSWPAFLPLADAFPMKDNSFAIAVGVWYHFTHGEILDGPGHGLDLFAASKRTAIKTFIDTKCQVDPSFTSLGEKATDLYDPAFAKAIGTMPITGDACTGEGAEKALCAKWRARYQADRPHLTGKAAKIPLLVLYGDQDKTIPPEREVCAFERLKADKANVTFCIDTGSDHTPLVSKRAAYVSDWIAARTLGAPEPTRCDRDETTLKDGAGALITCATPPPNDKD